MTRVGMPQRMEIGWGLDRCQRARLGHRTGLVRFAPTVAVRLAQHQLNPASARCKAGKQLDPFVVQYDMAPPPALAGADMQGTRIGVKVADLQCRQFSE